MCPDSVPAVLLPYAGVRVQRAPSILRCGGALYLVPPARKNVGGSGRLRPELHHEGGEGISYPTEIHRAVLQ